MDLGDSGIRPRDAVTCVSMPCYRVSRMLTVVLCVVLLLGAVRPDGLLASGQSDSERLYIGHQAGFSALIPSSWQIDTTGEFEYRSNDGFIGSSILPPQKTLFDACTIFARQYPATTGPLNASWSGKPACTFDVETSAGPGRVLVIPLPKPINFLGTEVQFAFILVDRAHFDRVVASMSFDSARVSPEAFVASVLDVVEAWAWWSDSVDWATERPFLLEEAAKQPDLASTQFILQQILTLLRGVGDNHSFLLDPRQSATRGQGIGFGMQANGGWVQAIFPGSPADRAGLHAGDHIVDVNGGPPIDTYGFDPANTWGPSVTLTVERRGESKPLSVQLVAGPFSGYRPTQAALVGRLGYIEVPQFMATGREEEFVAQANDQIAIIDRGGACGWIVDLRLNHGGNYSPMVSALGSILGNGTFVGWQQPNGNTIWVSYDDGEINQDGTLVANYLLPNERHDLATPMPPVAVLLGPQTASSGEVTALTFVGRPGARLFGTKTGGFTTANQTFRLFDGSSLVLAGAAMVDRTGETHLTGIVPDQIIYEDWSTFGTDQDPVIRAASDWLMTQPACAGVSATPVAKQ